MATRDIHAPESIDARADFLARLEYGLNPVVELCGEHDETSGGVGNHAPMRYSVGVVTNAKRPPAGASTPGLGGPDHHIRLRSS